ncbi:MAG: AAA family ATPase [Saprospiraceae bacterium]
MIDRKLKNKIEQYWDSGKILIVIGPRQVGKTTLLEGICSKEGDYLFLNGDDVITQNTLENIGEVQLKAIDWKP